MADLYDQVQQLEQRVNELENQKQAMERALGPKFIESLNERLDTGVEGDITSGGPTQSVDEQGSSSYDVAQKFDDTVQVDIDGDSYKIGLYTT